MNYIDEYITEQTERMKLSGLLQEFHITKRYNTIDDVPADILNDIIDLLISGQRQKANSLFHSIIEQITNITETEINNVAGAIRKIAADNQ